MTPKPNVTTVYWDDKRSCSGNAIHLIKRVYPDCSTLIGLWEETYETAHIIHGPGPRVTAENLAADTGHSVATVLSDDETLLNLN